MKRMMVKCPRCDYTEYAEVKLTLFPATYASTGGTAIEVQADIVNQTDLERRFERHYDLAHKT
jgi:hypothetical protein